MFGIGGWELFLIFLIVLLVFGAKRLPEIARSLGKATQEFKRAKNEFSNIANEPPPETSASTHPSGDWNNRPTTSSAQTPPKTDPTAPRK